MNAPELAVRDAVDAGRLQGNEQVPVKITLEFGPRGESYVVEGDITLD